MTAREGIKKQFKIGVLTKLAEAGILPSEFEVAAVNIPAMPKEAQSGAAKNIGSLAGPAVGAGWDALKFLSMVAVPAAAGMTGYLAAAPERVEESDLEAVRDMELIRQYREAAMELKKRKERAGRSLINAG